MLTSSIRKRSQAEPSQVTLKLKATDGKRRATDVADTEQLLRIIQSIPSKKAEPFKLWLAQVGRECIEETLDPELIADRLVSTYERAGYTQEWIQFQEALHVLQLGLVFLMVVLTDLRAFSSPVVSPPISTEIPLILLAIRRRLLPQQIKKPGVIRA